MGIVILGFTIGTVLGSFVKALADRSLNNKLFWGRSYCPHCKHILQWYDLLPVISYLSLSGKCRYCHKKIGVEYLLVEIAMGVLVGFLFWQAFQNFNFHLSSFPLPLARFAFGGLTLFLLDLIFKTFFVSVLAALFLTDLKKMLLPDRITLPAIVIGMIFIIIITVIKIIFLYSYLSQTRVGQLLLPPHGDYFQRHALVAAGPLFGGILMELILGGFFYFLIIITRGKGIGGGDVKLGAFMGLMLGFPQSILAVILGFLSGAIFALSLIFAGKKQFGQSIAFGPFLVIGALVALFWGDKILDWYLHLGS